MVRYSLSLEHLPPKPEYMDSNITIFTLPMNQTIPSKLLCSRNKTDNLFKSSSYNIKQLWPISITWLSRCTH